MKIQEAASDAKRSYRLTQSELYLILTQRVRCSMSAYAIHREYFTTVKDGKRVSLRSYNAVKASLKGMLGGRAPAAVPAAIAIRVSNYLSLRRHRRVSLNKARRLPALPARVKRLLKRKWSPRKVVKRAEKWVHQLPRGCRSAESIYARIRADKKSGGKMWEDLPRRMKYRRRCVSGGYRGYLPGPVKTLDQRTATHASRAVLGNLEVDTIHGSGSSHAHETTYDRCSRRGKLIRVDANTAQNMHDALGRSDPW